MKKLILGILLLVSTIGYSQIIVRTEGSEVFLKYKPVKGSLPVDVRLGPSAKKSLKQGLNKAIEWAELNKTHQKNFEKYVCSFKVMETKLFNYIGYDERGAKIMSLKFKGYSNGKFRLTIGVDIVSGIVEPEIHLYDIKHLKDFINLLNGKSVNPEIDDIFK